MTHACRDGSVATAAEDVATRQPQAQHPKATGGWGGSAVGAADFLNRLAQAEARDASSLEGPTPSPNSPKGSPKGPRVRHLSIGELTIERPSVGRAIEDLTLAEEERLSSTSSRRSSSTSPAVKTLSSSSTSQPIHCFLLYSPSDVRHRWNVGGTYGDVDPYTTSPYPT